MIRMRDNVFRMYDIRGIFPDELDMELAVGLGRVLGSLAGGSAVVGRDCRQSGSQLMEWLAEGMLSTGCHVTDLGVVTTPMTYFAAHTLGPGVTVMITGSHNPPEYNGFKIMRGSETLHGRHIRDLREGIESLNEMPADPSTGSIRRLCIREAYLDRLMAEFSFDRSLKVAIDAGNGTGGDVSVELLERLGCRVIPLFCDMDGSFPNHHPDPTVDENLEVLIRTVIEERADIGLAFDGDADRLGVVDGRGEVVRGDRVLMILADALLAKNPGATVISEVKASALLFQRIEKSGGRPVMSPTGHSLIKKAMAEENALLAGEMSGHIFFRDRYHGYDDALYAALRLLEILASEDVPLHDRLKDLPRVFSTPEIREECPDEGKFDLVARIRELLERDGYEVDTTDGARITFPNGWGLVRASNTQPVLVLRFEAGTPDALSDYETTTRKYIQEARRDIHV